MDDECSSTGEDSLHTAGREGRRAWQLDPTVLATYQPQEDSDMSTNLEEEQTLRQRKNFAVASFYQVFWLVKMAEREREREKGGHARQSFEKEERIALLEPETKGDLEEF